MKPEGQLVVQPVILGPVAVYFVIIQCLRIPEMFLVPVAHERLLSLELLPAMGAYSILELSGGSWKIYALKFFRCSCVRVRHVENLVRSSENLGTLNFLASGIMALDLLSLLLGSIFLRRWGCSRSSMTEQLQGFTFEAAKCEVEADRLEILGAIKVLARREGLVPPDASTRVLGWKKKHEAFWCGGKHIGALSHLHEEHTNLRERERERYACIYIYIHVRYVYIYIYIYICVYICVYICKMSIYSKDSI